MNGLAIRLSQTTLPDGRIRYEVDCVVLPGTQAQLVAEDGEVVVRWSFRDGTNGQQVHTWTDERADLVARIISFDED